MSEKKQNEQTSERETVKQDGDPFAREANDNSSAKGTPEDVQATSDETLQQPESMEARIADLEERLKRSVAEQENLRKRLEREKADIAKYAVSNFAREVLGIADNIQRAIEAVPREAAEQDSALKTFLEGIEVTERELHKAMERHGIAMLTPEGEKFDPNFHQAMFEIPTDEMPSGMVVQVVQPGYLLEDRVLRPAMVGVSKSVPAASGRNEGAATAHDQGEEAAHSESSKDDPAERESIAKAAESTPSDDTAGGSDTDERSSTQSRGTSRLNEPVINADTNKR